MGTNKLRAGVHIVRETPQVHFLRSHLNDPDLVTFFNTETGQWVLAYWIVKDKGIVDEIDDLGPNFEVMTREFVYVLEKTRKVLPTSDLTRRMKQNAADRARREFSKAEERQDEWAWCKKRHNDRTQLPWAFGTKSVSGGNTVSASPQQ